MKAIVKKILSNAIPPIVLIAAHKVRRHIQTRRTAQKLQNYSCLHLACGWNIIDHWANVDTLDAANVIYWNLLFPLPVKDDSIDFIFCEHFIEHVDRAQAKAFMSNCYRALKTGGVLRISTPSLRKIVADYTRRETPACEDSDLAAVTPCQVLNKYLHWWGHEFIYDEEEMGLLFSEAGFRENKKVPWRKSDHAELAGLEFRPDNADNIFEGTK